MTITTLTAISPTDGRYFSKTKGLSAYFSESALIYYRMIVEIRWFESLANNPKIEELPKLTSKDKAFLEQLINDFNEDAAQKVKDFEQKTNHDVKAVEYYLKEQFEQNEHLKNYTSFIHFASTSEDINNLAYALMMKEALSNVMLPTLAELTASITLLGKQLDKEAMLCHTHGQPATPSTMGKELINFAARLKRPQQQLAEVLITGKFNGAVGNYNAHVVAYPKVNWRKHCETFVTKLGLSFNPYTTQIEPHDCIAEISHLLVRINNILLDFSRDIWSYISLGYFTQKTVAGEVGSSTMPHKVNPIDFENGEGNIGLANALFNHFANKLTQSRLQRDLTDSTVLRNLGVAFAYTLIAYKSLLKGNQKLQINTKTLLTDLSNNWEILAEPIQTVMRRYNVPNAYEQLRDLTRGQGIDENSLRSFVEQLDIPNEAKKDLLALSPESYVGLASQLVKAFS
jgi:adenylosuccinate lyase